MEERRPRERELVLAPNEFAYVLDTTKGHINCYVGPHKTSLAQTDQPVVLDEITKRFVGSDDLAQAIQVFSTAPANWYLVLKNPAVDQSHPRAGVASGSVELQVGRQVIIPGPASFALWPGQIARVLEGHRLKSNQYLLARVYDAERAALHPLAALGRSPDASEAPLVVGEKLLIRGTDTRFYIPPDGIQVVPDDRGNHIRDAATLERLEYCVLVSESGKKRTVRGEAVVFPAPDEQFVRSADGQRWKFRAIELSEVTGLHLKVIAPYVDDDGAARREGEELFITGGSRIFFPREEHAIIKAPNGSELHHAVAIPAGEGRYVLDRLTGDIRLIAGPRMLLPDPRREVIVRRVLSDRECSLLYPGNDTVRAWNQALRCGASDAPTPESAQPAQAAGKGDGRAASRIEGVDVFARRFVPPRALVLDTRLDGAISIDVWSGYAVQVTARSGARRTLLGPTTVLLGWDEMLEPLCLSTGTPKSSDVLLSTVFLQVAGNQVSDVVDVVSSDQVAARVHLKYRVNFEGDGQRWFRVDNYVKLLCDHAGSLLKAAARKTAIGVLRSTVAELVRDTVLGARIEGARAGLAFDENAMRVVDIEVLDVEIVDPAIGELLDETQLSTVRLAVEVATRESALKNQERIEAVERQLLAERQKTKLLARALEIDLERQSHDQERGRLEHRAALLALKAEHELRAADADGDLRRKRLVIHTAEIAADIEEQTARQNLQMTLFAAQIDGKVRQAQAFSPELVAAVQRLSDAQLLSSLAANFGELAAVEGKGLLETARKFLDFVPQTSLPVLRSGEMRAGKVGDAE